MPACLLISVPDDVLIPAAAFFGVFALALANKARWPKAIAYAAAAAAGGLILVKAGLFARSPGGAAPNADGGLQDIVALILTALTGFAIFFFSRAREDLKEAQAKAVADVNALREEAQLAKVVTEGFSVFRVEVARAQLLQELAVKELRIQRALDGLEKIAQAAGEMSAENQKELGALREQEAVVKSVRRALSADGALNARLAAGQYETIIGNCLTDLHETLRGHSAEAKRRTALMDDLAELLVLIGQQYVGLHDEARRVRDSILGGERGGGRP